MKNRSVGILITGIAVLMGFIIFSFNRALTDIVNTTCSHGAECPMWGAIDFQTNVSTGIMMFVIAVGLYFTFFGKEEVVIESNQKKSSKKYNKIMDRLTSDETIVLEKVIEAEGAIFQSELVDKAKFSKAKVTRVLDKLEGKNLIERRRRGMSNVVILK